MLTLLASTWSVRERTDTAPRYLFAQEKPSPKTPRRPPHVTAIMALCLTVIPLSARAAVVATLPKPGEYAAWINAKDGSVVAGPIRAEGSKIVADTGTARNAGDWTLVVDGPDGNAAMQPVPNGESPRLNLKPEMFNRIARVEASITNKDGAAPDYATVVLTDGKGKSQTTRLTPSDQGVARFENVTTGDGKITVQQGDNANTQTVTVRLPLQRDTPLLSLSNDFHLPDGMKTLAGKSSGGKAATAEEPATRPSDSLPNTGRTALGFLIALVILAVIAWIFYYVLRKQGVTAKSALARAGVQLPDEEAAAGGTILAAAPEAIDPTICPFCGGRKDAGGTCPNCAIGAAPGRAASAGTGSGKRLVAIAGPRSGAIFPLTEAVTIGRDAARDIAVPEDTAMSRTHAIVKPTALGTEIIDQNSSNGTWVNGLRVQDRATIQPGDEVMLGGSRFRYED